MYSDLGGNLVIMSGGALLLGFMLGWLLGRVRRQPKVSKSTLDELISRQDQFISLGSHYLLTPISIIQTALARLQEADAALSSEQRRKLYDAIELGQRRLWIVAEQLVLENDLDHKSLKLQFAPNDFSEVVSGAIADVDVFARNKNVHITYTDSTMQFKEARFDPRRMRQALIALLDNSIKFSNPGGEVLVSLASADNNFILTIQDSGIGMTTDVLKHVTERFYRGSSLYDFNYEGLGLGLHIANAIFELHQGATTIQSAPNQGTVVKVQFPIM